MQSHESARGARLARAAEAQAGPSPDPTAGEELARLRRRVVELEDSVGEYRATLGRVLASRSWRTTQPLRLLAGQARRARVRLRRSWSRGEADPDEQVLLTGLFPPDPESLPVGSPLRRSATTASARGGGPRARRTPLRGAAVLVVAHVHHPELWGDIQDRLVRIPMPFDLRVTVTEGAAQGATATIMARYPEAIVDVVPNRGRDWAPLLMLAGRGDLHGYEAIVKVHTKRSHQRPDGDGWRLELLDGVLESPTAITRIVDLLSSDRGVGLIVPTGHIGTSADWGANRATVELLASRLPMAFDPGQLRFPAGSMFWSRPWLIERLADLGVTAEDFELEQGQLDGTTAHALERMIGIFAQVAGMDVRPTCDVRSRLGAQARPTVDPMVLAFFLPQYHANPENDRFWGVGYTDWDRVRAAKPQFRGHRQPLVPDSYYDLADPAELHRQAARLEHSGVDALMFYYYWFNGTPVLDTPLANLLSDPGIAMPFALCWANESWTKRWDGLDREVLLEQQYPPGWQAGFYGSIRAALQDPRYVRVAGCPLLAVYRLDLIPDLAGTVATWRALAQADGLPGLHILGVLPSRDFGQLPAGATDILDGLVAFPPGSAVRLASIADQIPGPVRNSGGDIFSYDVAADSPLPAVASASVPVHPCVFPSWDNTARRGRSSFVFHGANQLAYRRWLFRAIRANPGSGTRLVFINAWNEWAEGAAIEGTALPDVRVTGRPSLLPREAREPLRPFALWPAAAPDHSPRNQPRIAALVHVHYPQTWPQLRAHLATLPEDFDLWLSLTREAAHLAGLAQSQFANVRLIHPDGRGRDIAPLLMLVNEGLLAPYEYVVKVHSKRSPHRRDGDAWRGQLLHSLLPLDGAAGQILAGLRAHADIGLCSGDVDLGGAADWGSNLACVRRLAARRGWSLEPGELAFPMGSMFWAKGEVLADLAGFDIRYFEFEEEQGQLDGTLAHAIERLIGVANAQLGLRIVTAAELRRRGPTRVGRRAGRM